MKKIFGEFKDFIAKGNVIDLAVGVIIGGAFSGIVTSLVNDIVTPLITLITGRLAFADMFVVLTKGVEEVPATLAAAQEAGISTLNYGLFIQGVINFLITAFVIFLLVKGINTLNDKFTKKEEEPAPAEPTTKICPFCKKPRMSLPEENELMILSSEAEDKVEIVEQMVKERVKPKKIIYSDIGPIITSHAGTGVIGVYFKHKKSYTEYENN